MAIGQAVAQVAALILCDNALLAPVQLRGGVEVAAEAELQVHLQLQCPVVDAEVLTSELHLVWVTELHLWPVNRGKETGAGCREGCQLVIH